MFFDKLLEKTSYFQMSSAKSTRCRICGLINRFLRPEAGKKKGIELDKQNQKERERNEMNEEEKDG